jgi:hypothetical protein
MGKRERGRNGRSDDKEEDLAFCGLLKRKKKQIAFVVLRAIIINKCLGIENNGLFMKISETVNNQQQQPILLLVKVNIANKKNYGKSICL